MPYLENYFKMCKALRRVLKCDYFRLSMDKNYDFKVKASPLN